MQASTSLSSVEAKVARGMASRSENSVKRLAEKNASRATRKVQVSPNTASASAMAQSRSHPRGTVLSNRSEAIAHAALAGPDIRPSSPAT